MMSKLIRYTLPLITLLTMACSEEKPQPFAEDREAPVITRTLVNGGSDTNQLNTSEIDVRSVRIYIFDGNKLDRMEYFDVPEGGIQLEMRAKVAANKTFCAVVNELPGMKNELDHVATPTDLNGIMYSLADYINLNRHIKTTDDQDTPEGYRLPFYGQKDNVTITEEGANLSLEIERVVARVDVYLRTEEQTSFNCEVTPETTLRVERSADKAYFSSVLPNLTAGSDRVFTFDTSVQLNKAAATDKSDYKRIYSFYLPAQQFAQNTDRIQMTLADLTWGGNTKWTYDSFLFGDYIPSYDNTIRPNKVYKLYCTLSQAAFPVDVSVIVQDWDEKIQWGGV